MVISLENIGKKYSKQWVVRSVNQDFEPGLIYGITGANGTGKSTLLKIISSSLTPSEGSLLFSENSKTIDVFEAAKHITFAAPYIDLIPEMTLSETLDFHFTFKDSLVDKGRICDLLYLTGQETKRIKEFSSGMQQRLKLGLAILTKSKIILLDEPTTNLDEKGVLWFHELLSKYADGRTVIIASNIEEDYQTAVEVLSVETYCS